MKNLSDEVYELLKARILSGSIPFEKKISINDIVLDTNFGRSPISHALKRLQLEGLIVTAPKSGNKIWTPSYEEVENLLSFRRMLELSALRECCDVLQLHERLMGICEGMDRAIEDENWKEYEDLDRSFHHAIVESARNPFLTTSYQNVSDRVSLSRLFMKRNYTQSNEEHYSIAQSLKHNTFKASAYLEKHLLIWPEMMFSLKE
ncbi:hypothetical protein TW84_02890 [Vibrio neptunius]|uniref:GntR family transcriptional regulator n=1 Tax=Vibrio neptunius TaxID=170651 RepID=UPI0005FA1443|nr:GntR family transcriptional regulator [Vibrio neptunius]KJY93573.1 hypothetical protein TW84_02890 [Vibrio neptunius]